MKQLTRFIFVLVIEASETLICQSLGEGIELGFESCDSCLIHACSVYHAYIKEVACE